MTSYIAVKYNDKAKGWHGGKASDGAESRLNRASTDGKAPPQGGKYSWGEPVTGPRRADFNEFNTWLTSQKVVVMGKGKTGGKPIISIMKKYGIEPIIVDSKTQNPNEITKTADILVCAVGGRGTIINESMIKKDAILIAIGMSLGSDGKLHGDYEPEEIAERASYYTPVPGGVGPVNAAMLLVNVVEAAEKSIKN